MLHIIYICNSFLNTCQDMSDGIRSILFEIDPVLLMCGICHPSISPWAGGQNERAGWINSTSGAVKLQFSGRLLDIWWRSHELSIKDTPSKTVVASKDKAASDSTDLVTQMEEIQARNKRNSAQQDGPPGSKKGMYMFSSTGGR